MLVAEAVRAENDKVKLEISEVLQDEVSYRLGKYEKRRKRRDLKEKITDCQSRIILSHYPIAEWNNFHHGSYLIYGHIHNRTDEAYQYMKQFDRALNAGACINNYTPSSLNELIRNNKIFRENN